MGYANCKWCLRFHECEHKKLVNPPRGKKYYTAGTNCPIDDGKRIIKMVIHKNRKEKKNDKI